MSAVSKSVHPTSSAASTRRRALAQSPPPKRHIPHPRGATARPLFPSGMRVSAEGTRLIPAHSNSAAIQPPHFDRLAAHRRPGTGGTTNERVGRRKDRRQRGVLIGERSHPHPRIRVGPRERAPIALVGAARGELPVEQRRRGSLIRLARQQRLKERPEEQVRAHHGRRGVAREAEHGLAPQGSKPGGLARPDSDTRYGNRKPETCERRLDDVVVADGGPPDDHDEVRILERLLGGGRDRPRLIRGDRAAPGLATPLFEHREKGEAHRVEDLMRGGGCAGRHELVARAEYRDPRPARDAYRPDAGGRDERDVSRVEPRAPLDQLLTRPEVDTRCADVGALPRRRFEPHPIAFAPRALLWYDHVDALGDRCAGEYADRP